MTKTQEQLLNIWEMIWPIGGWFRLLEMTKNYDQEDLECLEEIDSNAIEYEKEAEKSYWEIELPKTRKQIDEFKKEFNLEFKKERRLEFLNDAIKKLQEVESKIWSDHQKATERDLPHWLRQAILELKKPWKIAGKIKSFQIEIYLLDHPEDFAKVDRVSPEQVARALEFPFDQLIQLNKAGFVKCIFHTEKTPSLHLIPRSNKVHCFGCGKTWDTIAFIMEKENISFKKAVRILAS